MKKLCTWAAGAGKWIIVLAVVYSGATQPLYLVVPKTAQQIEECLAQRTACVSACATQARCSEERGCATVPCEAVSHPGCPIDDGREQSSRSRCCSLFATQPGVEGSRLSVDEGTSHVFALLPTTIVVDVPHVVGVIADHTEIFLSSIAISPPPSRAPPLA